MDLGFASAIRFCSFLLRPGGHPPWPNRIIYPTLLNTRLIPYFFSSSIFEIERGPCSKRNPFEDADHPPSPASSSFPFMLSRSMPRHCRSGSFICISLSRGCRSLSKTYRSLSKTYRSLSKHGVISPTW